MGNDPLRRSTHIESSIFVWSDDCSQFIAGIGKFGLHIDNSAFSPVIGDDRWFCFVVVGPGPNLRNFIRYSAQMGWVKVGIRSLQCHQSQYYWKLQWKQLEIAQRHLSEIPMIDAYETPIHEEPLIVSPETEKSNRIIIQSQ